MFLLLKIIKKSYTWNYKKYIFVCGEGGGELNEGWIKSLKVIVLKKFCNSFLEIHAGSFFSRSSWKIKTRWKHLNFLRERCDVLVLSQARSCMMSKSSFWCKVNFFTEYFNDFWKYLDFQANVYNSWIEVFTECFNKWTWNGQGKCKWLLSW